MVHQQASLGLLCFSSSTADYATSCVEKQQLFWQAGSGYDENMNL
jgi:hypothetical protein